MTNFEREMRFLSETSGDSLAMLEFENDHVKRLAIVEQYIYKFISGDISWDVMCTLIPILKTSYQDILHKNIQLVKKNTHIHDPEILREVVNNLKILYKDLVALGCLSDHFISKYEAKIEVFNQFSVTLSEIILLTCNHCQESTSIYKYNENPTYFKDLINMLKNLFKSTSEVHAKLIKILLQCSTYNSINESEVCLLNEVLDALVNLGSNLMNFNFKLCADTWNSFLILLKKYSEIIFGLFSFDRPLNILIQFSINGLENVINDYGIVSNESDCVERIKDNTVQHLKEHRFIIKVITKIYQTISLRRADCIIFWIYFIKLYRFSKPILILRNSCQKIIELINEYIFQSIQPLFRAIISGFKFKQIANPSNEILEASKESGCGFLLIINSILLSSNINLNNNDVADILQAAFSAITHYKGNDFFRNEILISNNDTSHDLYSELLVNLTCYLLTLPKDSYTIVELMIIKSIFSENTRLGLFSMDLFCILIRQTNPSFCYDVICDIIDRTLTLTTAVHTDTKDYYRLSSLLRILYCNGPLDESMRFKLLTKYPLPSMSNIWRHLGLYPVPKSKAFVQGLMLEYAENAVGEFNNKAKLAEREKFLQMIQYLDILSSIPLHSWSPNDKSKLTTIIEKLWFFDSNNLILLKQSLFTTYLRVSIHLTIEVVQSIDVRQIKKIMDQVKMITATVPTNDKFKLLAILLLNKCISMLSTKEGMSEAFEPSAVAELLNEIFLDDYGNDFVKCQVLGAVQYADKSILKDSIEEFAKLTDASAEVTHFPGLISDTIRFGSDVEFLQHNCIDLSAVADSDECPVPVPSSSSECAVAGNIREQMDDVTKALDCIRSDVKVLQTYHKTFKFSQRNVSGIFNVIDDLKRLV